MKWYKVLNLILCIFLFNCLPITAVKSEVSTSSRYNYLYILVPSKGNDSGIFDGRAKIKQFNREFSWLKQYLETEYSLGGYVYSYDFSNTEMDIAHQGWELGDRNYDNPGAIFKRNSTVGDNDDHRVVKDGNNRGRSMLEQAKEDFIDWFKTKGPGKDRTVKNPLPNEIPKDYILICHSMGGLAARHYIYGTGSNGQRYYRNDVAKVIFISTPHLGSSGVIMKEVWDEIEKNGTTLFFGMMGMTALSGQMLGVSHPLTIYLAFSSAYYLLTPVTDEMLSSLIGLEYTPAFNDLKPASAALRQLNSADPNSEYNSLYPVTTEAYEKAASRIIYGNGVCIASTSTATEVTIQRAVPILGMGMYLINSLGFSSIGNPEPSSTVEGRILGVLLSMLTGYPILANGDLFRDGPSGRGEGIESLKGAKIFPYTFQSASMLALEADLGVMAAALTFLPLPDGAKALILLGGAVAGVGILAAASDTQDFLSAHGKILDRITQKQMKYDPVSRQLVSEENNHPKVAQALFDLPEAGDVHCPGEKSFKLLTDYSTTEGKNTGVFREVEIGSYHESSPNSGNPGVSIVIDTKRRLIDSISVKEPPTRIEGVLRDFMPRKMQYFQYSENFAARKDINVLNDYGHFIIDGLKLAEGQNAITFQAKNKVGYTSNSVFKIILNTIPMVASEFSILPGTFTGNNKPTFKAKFGKTGYSADNIENPHLISAIRRSGTEEVDVTSKVKTTVGGGAYDKHLWFEYTPDEPLPDGQYTLIVTVGSNVGTSQAVMDVTIDTQAPTLAIQPFQPYSPRAPATIRWSASDEASPNLLSARCDLYSTNNQQLTTDNFVANIATAESLSKGENFFTWDPMANGSQLAPTGASGLPADGSYKIKIKAFDLAGNYAIAEQPISIDSTSPVVTGVEITPNPLTSKTTEMGLTARVNEKSTIIIKLNNTTNNSTAAYLTQASTPLPLGEGTGVRASYSWKYNDMFTKGPEDGIYNVEVIAKDEAGNESVPRTLEAVRVDRTPPKIYGQITQPYVLANSGKNAYQTTLSYNLSDASSVKIKIYNANTGVWIDTILAPPASNTSTNQVPFDGSNADKYPKGAYRFQIIAEDDFGNLGVAFASCVKDGIAPVISFPDDDNAEVAGTISIRGTAIETSFLRESGVIVYPDLTPGSSKRTTLNSFKEISMKFGIGAKF